ncbi:hypothetical protein HA45_24585 [Pantoea rodasii]|nr:hypothetical protein HA45_24585 [Pantoea rodasii]
MSGKGGFQTKKARAARAKILVTFRLTAPLGLVQYGEVYELPASEVSLCNVKKVKSSDLTELYPPVITFIKTAAMLTD